MITRQDFIQTRWVTGELAGPTGTGITQTTGHANVAEVAYAGADVSTNIADCTGSGGSISAPGAWTDIIDFNIGSPISVFISPKVGVAAYSSVVFSVDSGEDAADAIRVQIIIDGVTVWDQTATKSVSDVEIYLRSETVGSYLNTGVFRDSVFKCNSSFKLRATRNGTFANAQTTFNVGESYYIKYQ